VSGGMPPDTWAGDLGGGFSAQFRVRPEVVVVVPPGVEHEAGVGPGLKQRLVKAFVAQAPVEALDETVLRRLAPRAVMPFDLPFLRPAQDCRRGQLGVVSARPATASAPAFPRPACGRRDGVRAGLPRGRFAAASCGWASYAPEPEYSPGDDSPTGGVPPPDHATAAARAHHHLWSTDTGSPGGSRRPDCTPDARP